MRNTCFPLGGLEFWSMSDRGLPWPAPGESLGPETLGASLADTPHMLSQVTAGGRSTPCASAGTTPGHLCPVPSPLRPCAFILCDFALYLFTINPSCLPSLPSESSNMGALAQSPFPILFSFHLPPLAMLECFNYLSCLLSSPHGRAPLPQSLRCPSITPHRPTKKYPGRVWYVLNDNYNSFISKAGSLGL